VCTGWAINSFKKTLLKEKIRKSIHKELLEAMDAIILFKDNDMIKNNIGINMNMIIYLKY